MSWRPARYCSSATAGCEAASLSPATLMGSVSTQVPQLLGAALARLPAVLVLAAVAVLLTGLLPWESTALAWSAVALAEVVAVFGPPLLWPGWMMDISPFTQTPKLPGATVPAQPLLWLCGIALALSMAGLTGLRHRDLGDLGPSHLTGPARDWLVGYIQQSKELSQSAAAASTAQPPGTTSQNRPLQPPDQKRRTG
jgi:hypothetical protein